MSKIINNVTFFCDYCNEEAKETIGEDPYGWYSLTKHFHICPECIRVVQTHLIDIIQDYPIDNESEDYIKK